MAKSTRVIAVSNQKGGVGKTTTAVATAHALALRGYMTVLIDLDSQGNAATCLGLKPSPALFQVLVEEKPLEDTLVEARHNLWFLASEPISTTRVKEMLGSRRYREAAMADLIDTLECDFVILDTGPNRDLLHDNAHEAAGEIIIPAALEHLALIGVGQEFDTLAEVRKHGHPVEVKAILPTFYDSVSKETAANLKELVDHYGPLVLPAVPRTVKLKEAPAYGQTLWEYVPPSHPATLAYTRLVERVLHGL